MVRSQWLTVIKKKKKLVKTLTLATHYIKQGYKESRHKQTLTTDCWEGVLDRAMTSEHHWLIRSKALKFQSRHAALLMDPLD